MFEVQNHPLEKISEKCPGHARSRTHKSSLEQRFFVNITLHCLPGGFLKYIATPSYHPNFNRIPSSTFINHPFGGSRNGYGQPQLLIAECRTDLAKASKISPMAAFEETVSRTSKRGNATQIPVVIFSGKKRI